MPTLPEKKNLKASSVEVLNAIRNEASNDYRAAVPVAQNNLDSVREIGNAILNFEPVRNEFLNALINRIGRVIVTSKLYDNPWARFKKGVMELGETIEEIFVDIARPFEYDPAVAEKKVFARVQPNVRAAFHTLNFQKFYKQTINRAQLRQAFLNWEGVTDLINKITQSMYTGANYDEFLVMKYMIAKGVVSGKFYPVSIPVANKANADDVVINIKGIANTLTFMGSSYNYAGVRTFTDFKDQVVIINSQFEAVMGVSVLATAFNRTDAEFMGERILVDSFSNLDEVRLQELFEGDPNYAPLTDAEKTMMENVPAVVVDKDWFMIFDNLIETGEIWNPEGLYWNYWLHTWKIFSSSPFANAIAFTSATSSVTSVTVTPGAATVNKGASVVFGATVETTGLAPQSVSWSTNSTLTSITQDGYLTVNPDETLTSITVTATSTYDPSVKGTATVTVGA